MFSSLLFNTVTQVTVGLTVITIGLLVHLYKRSKEDYPDGPLRFPILGNLPQIIAAGDMVKFLEKNREIYGNVFTAEMGGLKRVVISGANNLQYLLIKNADFTSNRTPNSMTAKGIERAQTTPGLLWAPYPDWKTVRSFALAALREEGMGKTVMEPKILTEIELYINHFIQPCLETPIDITLSLTYATSNIISQMVFEERFDYEDTNLHVLNAAFNDGIQANMKAAITKNIPFATYLPGDLTGQRLDSEVGSIIMPKMEAMVAEARKNLDTKNANNFLSQALLKARSEESKGNKDSVFTDANIQLATVQLYAAGTETTSTALRWALLYMVLFPDIQERVRKEIHDAIGERQVSMKDRLSLPYSDAVLHEVLRSANIAPTNLPHTLEKEIVLEGKKIPAGAELLFNMHSVLNDPELFSEPNMFNPERFLGETGQALKSKMAPFSIGRRACLGESLARMEFFLFFVTFLQKFKVKYPPNQRPSLDANVSIVRTPREYQIIFERC